MGFPLRKPIAWMPSWRPSALERLSATIEAMVRDQLQQAVDLLEARFGLDVLWVFGSEARGTARPDSDVDLAALFQRPPQGLEIFDARTDLEALLHRDVDLVDLDQASPILGMQVLRYGRLLADRNPQRRIAFFTRTVKMYEDLKILRRDTERALFERVSSARP